MFINRQAELAQAVRPNHPLAVRGKLSYNIGVVETSLIDVPFHGSDRANCDFG